MSDAPDIPTPWLRIERVPEFAESANRLAEHLGLPRGENLCHIKRATTTSAAIWSSHARQIPPVFALVAPYGCGVAEQRENELAARTLYDDLTDLEVGIPSRITLPVAGGAQVVGRAVRSAGARHHPAAARYAPEEEPQYGNLHVVERTEWRMVRTRCRDTRPGMVVLRAPADGECTVVPRRQIGALWLVTALIGKTVR